jgi:hypothetical protein
MRRILNLTLILALLAPRLAKADEVADKKDQASTLIDEGNRLMSEKKFDEALERYKKAYQTFPSAKIFLNIAEANRMLGRPGPALDAYQQFIEEGQPEPGSPIDQTVRTRMGAIRASSGYLSMRSEVAGVEVQIDQAQSITLPHDPVAMPPGKHVLDARSPLGSSVRLEVAVKLQETLPVEFQFAQAPPPPPPDRRPDLVANEQQTTRVEQQAPAESSGLAWWVWAGIGVLVAGAATAAAVAISSNGSGGFEPMGDLGRSSLSGWRHL